MASPQAFGYAHGIGNSPLTLLEEHPREQPGMPFVEAMHKYQDG